jgi:hypothetical protein
MLYVSVFTWLDLEGRNPALQLPKHPDHREVPQEGISRRKETKGLHRAKGNRSPLLFHLVIPAKPNYIKTMQLKENVFYKTSTGIKVYAKPGKYGHWDYFDALTHKCITNVYEDGRAAAYEEHPNDLVSVWTPFLEVGKTYKTRNGEHEVLVKTNKDPYFKAFRFIGIIDGDKFDETYNCYYHENGQMDSVVEQDWDLVEEVKEDQWEVYPQVFDGGKRYVVTLKGAWQASFRTSNEAEAWMASQP